MTISSERNLIEKIRMKISAQEAPAGDLVEGIGDDAAVFMIDADRFGLITTDMSVEDRHFRKKISSPEDIGFKAMTGNVSDIAAMGGTPKFAFVSIGIPPDTDEKYILSIYDGLIEAAGMSSCVIAGGDTSTADRLIISIALYGETTSGRPVLRKGARPGDSIYCTGTTGSSLAGFRILSENLCWNNEYPSLIEKHLRPLSRIDVSSEIIERFRPTSMIDVSDGILSDLRRLSEASGAGFILHKSRLSLSDELKEFASRFRYDAHDLAMESGEEYELLFTASINGPEVVTAIKNIPVTKIGTVTTGGYMIEINGNTTPAPDRGYDHFRRG